MKKLIVLLLVIVMLLSNYSSVQAASRVENIEEKDEIILTIKVGDNEGEVGYSDSFMGGGDGPEAYAIIEQKIYIVDNVNKRMNVYSEGDFEYSFEIPYIVYIRSVVISEDIIYFMDFDAGKIYKTSLKGDLIEEIILPDDMEYYYMQRLYVREDGKVYLQYETEMNEKNEEYNIYAYSLEDLKNNNKRSVKGITIKKDEIYNISKTEDGTISVIGDDKSKISVGNLIKSISLESIDDKNNMYFALYKQLGTTKNDGEYTVQKYSEGECKEVVKINLDEYYYMPDKVIFVSDEGEVFQMKCFKDRVDIIKKTFIPISKFTSSIYDEKDVEEIETKAIVYAPNTKSTTMNNAISCCTFSWTYGTNNDNNPDSTSVTTPDYLRNVSTPSSQTGIPYCWGGFDGLVTSSSSGWSSFSNAMSNGVFAGNVNCTGGWKSSTAGLDCSGFVSSVAGFSSKLSTVNLAQST